MVDKTRLVDYTGQDVVARSFSTGYGSALGGVASTVSAGSTLQLGDGFAGRLVLLDTLTGSTVTLPASTGSGNRFRFLVSVLATSNNHIVKVQNTTDVMRGSVIFADTDGTAAVNGFITAATSDTVTLNRSTTGSVTVGEYFELEDYLAGFWLITGFLSNTGTPATPFSATV